MDNVNNIYLVGFMGTGKSAVARRLAKRLDRKAVELDDFIEDKEGNKISDIFEKRGEEHFRKVEKEMLATISESLKLVVSCGGGVVLDNENIEIMKKTGIIICLSSRPEVIISRTSKSSHRPLLNVDDPLKKIKELLSERAPFYAKADCAIDSSDIKPSEVVDIITRDILPNVKSR